MRYVGVWLGLIVSGAAPMLTRALEPPAPGTVSRYSVSVTWGWDDDTATYDFKMSLYALDGNGKRFVVLPEADYTEPEKVRGTAPLSFLRFEDGKWRSDTAQNLYNVNVGFALPELTPAIDQAGLAVSRSWESLTNVNRVVGPTGRKHLMQHHVERRDDGSAVYSVWAQPSTTMEEVPGESPYRTVLHAWEHRYIISADGRVVAAQSHTDSEQFIGRKPEGRTAFRVRLRELSVQRVDAQHLAGLEAEAKLLRRAIEAAKKVDGPEPGPLLASYEAAHPNGLLRPAIGPLKEKLPRLRAATVRRANAQAVEAGLLNQPAPDFALRDLHGKTIKLSALHGKVVLLSFWFAACPPCMAEAPHLAHLYETYHDRGLEVLWINGINEAPDVVRKIVDKKKLPFPVLRMDRQFTRGRYGVWGYPTTYLLDDQGVIRRRWQNFNRHVAKEMDQAVAAALASRHE